MNAVQLQLDQQTAQALEILARRFGHADALALSENKEQAAHMMQAMWDLEQQLKRVQA